ncbi:rod-binding protein [Fertoebacter nigrum]|uniref:Rod-binding protein n=1 Tax=Fertoeibacter niger TaxID=2656921 RepID=A0A8X8H2C1_9RHOB|nr:rod-binding protein [Fertoeibacter niger]NUB44912.1 rod-binding protein [Fertoeibacter niger]
MIIPANLAPNALPPDPLRQKAVELEAAFLSEMLAHAGLSSDAGAFGGGIGQDQFASFLRQEQAMAMAQRGGIGLAEHLFRAMSLGAAGPGPEVNDER